MAKKAILTIQGVSGAFNISRIPKPSNIKIPLKKKPSPTSLKEGKKPPKDYNHNKVLKLFITYLKKDI